MFKKSKFLAVVLMSVILFSIAQPVFAEYRTGSAEGDAAAYGTVGAVIAGGIVSFITGGLALPFIGAAIAGGTAGYYGYTVEDKTLAKDALAVGGSVIAGAGGAGFVGAVAEGVGILASSGAAGTAAKVAGGTAPIVGGSYGQLRKNAVSGTQVHHMPADSISPIPRNEGPAIRMDAADHMRTASYGSSSAAIQYRAQQQNLINQGRMREAIQMDIDDIHSKFGSKYDDAINEMLHYYENK